MNVKRKAYEDKLDAQLDVMKTTDAETREVYSSRTERGVIAQMGRTTGHTADRRLKSLAEAVILQSIEDLWNPISKKGSLKFFEGSGFKLYSKMAGIRYSKQLAVLKMLADSGKRGH